MDDQKKQRLMLAGLMVLVLGTGSYWFLGWDSDGRKVQAVATGDVVRRQSERVAEAKPNARRPAPGKREPKTQPQIKRRTRPDDEQINQGRRTRRPGGRRIEKQKELKPSS